MPGLDEFNRFIDKNDTSGKEDAGSRKRAKSAPTPETTAAPAPNVRYVLKHGITVAVPVEPAEQGLNGKLEMPRTETANGENPAELWNRLPRHIQLLASIPEPIEEEVAAKYYTRGFKETRQQLIERLLNPTLTLEETARVLGVCPATVRRYTNRGILPHHRTVGQQRRFRLSDVLVFLEQQYTRHDPVTLAGWGTRDSEAASTLAGGDDCADADAAAA